MKLDRDPDMGTPRFVRRRSGFLSAPAYGATPEEIAAAFVAANGKTFTLAPSDLQPPHARVTRDVTTRHSGMRSLTWQQQKDGLDLYRATFALNVTADNRIVNAQSRALHFPSLRFHDQVKVSESEAAQIAATHVNGLPSPTLNPDTRAPKPIWYPLDQLSVVKAWDVTVDVQDHPETHRLIVRADTGKVVEDIDMTWSLETATFNVYTSDSPVPTTPGAETPADAVLVEVPRTLVTLTAFATNASPQGWIPAGENRLVGNNATVYADWDDDNSPDSPAVTGAPYRVFDRPCDLSLAPSNYVQASQVQAFYVLNVFHDRLWQLGFDEAAGNFQTENFGRGGTGGDAMTVEVQNNLVKEAKGTYGIRAWYTGYGDGTPGKIAITVASKPPRRDGALDAHLLFHEAAHGVSTRLIGNGFGLTTAQSRGLGEGWGDFFPLALLSEASDPLAGTYPFGSYSAARFGQTQHAYFGSRRFPYCIQTNKAPQTLADGDPNQMAFPAEVPIDTYYASPDADEIHNLGEIWCLMLWECRANLIEALGYVGNETMLQLVVDGMKLTPENPTFVEARDALLQADLVDYGGTNQLALWKGFAKRGLGYGAVMPPSVSTVGIVESYDLPFAVDAQVTEAVGDGDGHVEPGESGGLTLVLTSHELALSNITATLVAVSSNATVTASNAVLPAIEPGATSTSAPPFAFSVDSVFPGNTDAAFTLRVSSDKGWFEQPVFVRIGNPDDYPPEIAGIAVTNLGETNAFIVWRTGIPANGRVEYGLDTSYGLSTALDPTPQTNHLADITGLARGTTYHYRIVSEGTNGLTAMSGDGTFRTRSRVYVDSGSAVPEETGAIEAPFKSLQMAAEAARVYGDTILVAAGTYTSAQVEAVLDLDGSGYDLTVEGGYQRDFSVRDAARFKTVIDGQQARRGIRLDNGARLASSGVTITHGQGEWGGGVHVRKSKFSASDCVITENASTNGINSIGGGVYGTLASTVSLSECHIEKNCSDFGGGVFAISSGTSVVLWHTDVKANWAFLSGGGTELELAAQFNAAGSVFASNTGGYSGGGINVAPYSTASLDACVVASNSASLANDPETLGGGGISVSGPSSVATLAMEGCIVYANTSPYGGDLRCASMSDVHVIFSDIGDIYGRLTTSHNVISADPLFANPTAGDFHLLYGSPCIDASSTNAGGGLTDMDGEVRPFGSAMDIGVDEFTDADGDRMADYWEKARFGSVNVSDGTGDADGDGLRDFQEYMRQTEPLNRDTDGDQAEDGWEVAHGFDPLNPDQDHDGMWDGWEASHGLNAFTNDAALDPDHDSMNNLAEFIADTDPRDSNSVLQLLNVSLERDGIRLDWQGGRDSWQFLETATSLVEADSWAWILGFPPPRPPTNAVIYWGETNATRFYRIRAER